MYLHTSRAEVATEAAARYAKQLVSHLGHKIAFTEEPDGSWTTAIGAGRGRVSAGPAGVTLTAEAPDADALAAVEQVLGSHLERFARREALTVTWRPAA